MNMSIEKTSTKYQCPICQGFMVSFPGDSVSLTNGVTIRCENNQCNTFENVYGHGKNDAVAYENAKLKFVSDSKKKS